MNIYYDHEDSHSHRNDCPMGCDVVWQELTFGGTILPPSSGSKSKPKRQMLRRCQYVEFTALNGKMFNE
jgi:hypothetical protein